MNLYTFIAGSVAVLIQLYSDKFRQDDLALTLAELEDDDSLPNIKVYDFIVVGGGTAGCVMANRLSEFYSVLLLEAGGTPVPATAVPIFQTDVALSPSINYKYTSTPQRFASLESGGIIDRIPGKMLGGSTSHHGLVYNRGNPLGYDSWANATNDPSWKYQNVLKYFKKSENFIGTGFQPQHGHDGLLTVDTNIIPILSTWLDAGAELGFRKSLDPNGPQTQSFSAVAITRKSGRRVSTYTAFIKPFEGFRPTLRVERYSQVSEILINERKRAYGVAYTRHQIPQIAHASKEVIISCGTFATPILLMKSGIGPSNILTEAGIPVVADLPVGEGIQEHAAVSLDPFTVNDVSLFPRLTKELNEENLRNYQRHEESVLENGLVGAQAFVVSSRAKRDGQPNWPDFQIDFNDGFTSSADQKVRSIGFFIVLCRPKSAGTISLNTTAYKFGIRNDEDLAVIDYNILSEPTDVDVLVEGIKLALSIMENTTSFQKLGANFTATSHPGCLEFAFRSDDYWRCYIHQLGTTWLHLSAACKMGFGPNDTSAVLDSKLNVLGISNLKVVDASVMPSVPNANTVAPVIMIAEKASDEILKTWKYIAASEI